MNTSHTASTPGGGLLRVIAARIAQVKPGAGDAETLIERARPRLDGARDVGSVLLDVAAVTAEDAQHYFLHGHGGRPPAIFLDACVDKLLAGHRDGLDPVAVAEHARARLFERGDWRRWLADPRPDRILLQLARWSAATLRTRDPLAGGLPVDPQRDGGALSNMHHDTDSAARDALVGALRTRPVAEAELLHLAWAHELNELEIRWLLERDKPIHHRIEAAFKALARLLKRVRPELFGGLDLDRLSPIPPRQSDRRQEATRQVRLRLPATALPDAPVVWQGFPLVEGEARCPPQRPRRARLVDRGGYDSEGRAADAVHGEVLTDDEVAAIALGWLYGCHWSARSDVEARRPRAARLAHLLAMGYDAGAIRAVIEAPDGPEVHDGWEALSATIVAWLVDGVGVGPAVARQWVKPDHEDGWGPGHADR